VRLTQLAVGCTGSVAVAGAATGAVIPVNVVDSDCVDAAGRDHVARTLDDHDLASAAVVRSSHRARVSACDLASASHAQSSHRACALAFYCSLYNTKSCAAPTSSKMSAPIGTSAVATICDCIIDVAGGDCPMHLVTVK
jgi:hypothetical protein